MHSSSGGEVQHHESGIADAFSLCDTLFSGSCESIEALDTEVVIIGNGPAGLVLSSFLSGWQPFYDVNHPYPDHRLHSHLSRNAAQSLLDQDLQWFEEEFADILNPSVRPVTQLFDMLMHNPGGGSCLRYVNISEHTVPHVVLGDSDIGGSWNAYDDKMVTVSLSTWLDLPILDIGTWLQGHPDAQRLPAGVVRDYLKEYARRLCLTKNIQTHTRIFKITKMQGTKGNDYFVVEGTRNGASFSITCRKVVLACGRSYLKHLNVAGEEESYNVVYDVASMKKLIDSKQPTSLQRLCVVVVGDGISAADAVNHALQLGLPVKHVIRRRASDLKYGTLAKLNSAYFPEYSRVYNLMTGKKTHSLYQSFFNSNVISVEKESVTVQSAQGTVELACNVLVVCIGRRADLSMASFPVEINADYRCEGEPRVFAVGSVADDHFIRYVSGGCLQVSAVLLREYKDEVAMEKVNMVHNKMKMQLLEVQQRQKRLRRRTTGRCCLSMLSTTLG